MSLNAEEQLELKLQPSFYQQLRTIKDKLLKGTIQLRIEVNPIIITLECGYYNYGSMCQAQALIMNVSDPGSYYECVRPRLLL